MIQVEGWGKMEAAAQNRAAVKWPGSDKAYVKLVWNCLPEHIRK